MRALRFAGGSECLLQSKSVLCSAGVPDTCATKVQSLLVRCVRSTSPEELLPRPFDISTIYHSPRKQRSGDLSIHAWRLASNTIDAPCQTPGAEPERAG